MHDREGNHAFIYLAIALRAIPVGVAYASWSVVGIVIQLFSYSVRG